MRREMKMTEQKAMNEKLTEKSPLIQKRSIQGVKNEFDMFKREPDPSFGDEKPKGAPLTADEKAKRAAALRAKLQLPDTVRKKLGDDGPLKKLNNPSKEIPKSSPAKASEITKVPSNVSK